MRFMFRFSQKIEDAGTDRSEAEIIECISTKESVALSTDR